MAYLAGTQTSQSRWANKRVFSPNFIIRFIGSKSLINTVFSSGYKVFGAFFIRGKAIVQVSLNTAKHRLKSLQIEYYSYTVDSEYLYKTGANLYDRNRFAPVFISLHSYQASGSSPAGLVTRGAGHPKSCGREHPDVSGSR